MLFTEIKWKYILRLIVSLKKRNQEDLKLWEINPMM